MKEPSSRLYTLLAAMVAAGARPLEGNGPECDRCRVRMVADGGEDMYFCANPLCPPEAIQAPQYGEET